MKCGDILKSIDEKKNVDEELVPRLLAGTVLGDVLKLHLQLNDACDKKANFILAISGLILMFTLTQISQYLNANIEYGIAIKVGFILTISSALISAALSVFVIKPTIENSDRLNLFYYGSFCNMLTKEQYEMEMKKLVDNKEDIIKQYAYEIYELSEYDLKPRFKQLKIASKILILSLVFGTVTTFSYLIN